MIELISIHIFAEVKKWLSSWLFCVSLLSLALSLSSPWQALANEVAIKKLMSMSLEELIEVNIALPTRNPLPIHKAPAIATVITAKEIRNMGARNLLDILRRVPGVEVNIASTPLIHSVAIRGIKTLYSEKILVMIEGTG